jgi:hypothetical protein
MVVLEDLHHEGGAGGDEDVGVEVRAGVVSIEAEIIRVALKADSRGLALDRAAVGGGTGEGDRDIEDVRGADLVERSRCRAILVEGPMKFMLSPVPVAENISGRRTESLLILPLTSPVLEPTTVLTAPVKGESLEAEKAPLLTLPVNVPVMAVAEVTLPFAVSTADSPLKGPPGCS